MEALAVKYRPRTFDDVVEQTSVRKILEQQIATGTIKNAYLFCGSAGTGKTTCARIFAREINKGTGEPIEVDAASNNSVDDVRQIIQQAKTQSLDSEYRIWVLDECVTGDTEILTVSGYKRMDSLSLEDLIAQYNDDGTVEFVKPIRLVKKYFNGDLECWSPRRGHTIKMTPHHIQPVRYNSDRSIRENYIKDLKFGGHQQLIVAGKSLFGSDTLTDIDRMAIISQADGTIQQVSKKHTRWTIHLAKERKIDRFLEIANRVDCDLVEIKARRGCRRFAYSLPNDITKDLTTHFNLNISYNFAREFVNECVQWDGHIGDKYLYYSSVVKANVDFVSAVATLGGYCCKQIVQKDNRKSTYRDMHRLFMRDKDSVSCQCIEKTRYLEHYEGYVYCVEIPSHKIIIRADGFTFITGNCHAFSNNAWQAFLKLLEEPPKKSIFIFCTTNPERIPATILSRVQRYDFKKLSQQAIVDRLKYIIDSENGGEQPKVQAKPSTGRLINAEQPSVSEVADEPTDGFGELNLPFNIE